MDKSVVKGYWVYQTTSEAVDTFKGFVKENLFFASKVELKETEDVFFRIDAISVLNDVIASATTKPLSAYW